MCKEEGPKQPSSHALACWVVLSCGSREPCTGLEGVGGSRAGGLPLQPTSSAPQYWGEN